MSKTIEVSDETWDKIKEVVEEEGESMLVINELDEFIGKKLLIRTVTYHLVGEVKNRIGNLFELKNASWVADTGRFHDSLKDGFTDSAEIEPAGQVWVNVDTIVDIYPWTHELPKKQQ